MIYVMWKTQTPEQNPVIQMEFTVQCVTELDNFWMNKSKVELYTISVGSVFIYTVKYTK